MVRLSLLLNGRPKLEIVRQSIILRVKSRAIASSADWVSLHFIMYNDGLGKVDGDEGVLSRSRRGGTALSAARHVWYCASDCFGCLCVIRCVIQFVMLQKERQLQVQI